MKSLCVMLVVISACTCALAADAPKEAATPPPSPNGIELPQGYLDWRVLSVTSRSDNGTLRAILGNDTAIAATETGEISPWPDGTTFCKLVWKQVQHPDWAAATVPGDFVQAEFMVKDSKLYPNTGGWGFARWVGLDQKPFGADASFANTCFQCHKPEADHDYVFTRPPDVPGRRSPVAK
jgi:hypothetical protein